MKKVAKQICSFSIVRSHQIHIKNSYSIMRYSILFLKTMHKIKIKNNSKTMTHNKLYITYLL